MVPYLAFNKIDYRATTLLTILEVSPDSLRHNNYSLILIVEIYSSIENLK